MLVPLLYALPSLWFGALVTFWLNVGLSWILASCPYALLTGMAAGAFYVFVAGLVLALTGLMITVLEVMKNYKTPYNIDALLCFVGALFMVLAFLLSPHWFLWAGYFLTTLFFACSFGIALVRLMVMQTTTALGSLGLFALTGFILGGWTLFSM